MRAAIYERLSTDPELLGLLSGEPNIFPNYGFDTVPVDNKPFIIIRYGNKEVAKGIRRGPRVVSFWAHYPKFLSADFGIIDDMLKRIDQLVSTMEHVPGGDGYTVTSALLQGEGPDHYDESFRTITRSADYLVLSRLT